MQINMVETIHLLWEEIWVDINVVERGEVPVRNPCRLLRPTRIILLPISTPGDIVELLRREDWDCRISNTDWILRVVRYNVNET